MKFEFHNPTRLIFAAGSLSRLGEIVQQKGKRALVVTGGGSVKRSGTFARAVASLEAAGVSVVECSGIEPNPRITSVMRGAEFARAISALPGYQVKEPGTVKTIREVFRARG